MVHGFNERWENDAFSPFGGAKLIAERLIAKYQNEFDGIWDYCEILTRCL